MPASAYEYTGTEARYYPGLGLHAKPADKDGPATVAEFDDRPAPSAEDEPPLQQPDGARWVPDDGRWKPTKKKPTPAAVPAVDAAATTGDAAGDGQKEA